MTGLDKILGRITEDAQAEAAILIEETEKQSEAMLDEKRLEAQTMADAIIKKSEQSMQEAEERASSSAQLDSRNKLLTFKQEYIDQLIEEACAGMENAEEKVYFDTLLKLVKQYAQKVPAVMQLNQRDLDRLPENFQSQVQTAANVEIKLSSAPADIAGGFLLIYDGIDQNCSFKSLFADRMDDLRDAARKMLFEEAVSSND